MCWKSEGVFYEQLHKGGGVFYEKIDKMNDWTIYFVRVYPVADVAGRTMRMLLGHTFSTLL
jgi:hypothetical protein